MSIPACCIKAKFYAKSALLYSNREAFMPVMLHGMKINYLMYTT